MTGEERANQQLLDQGLRLMSEAMGGLKLARHLIKVLDDQSREVRTAVLTAMLPHMRADCDKAVTALMAIRSYVPQPGEATLGSWEQTMDEMDGMIGKFSEMLGLLEKYVS